MLIKKDVSGNKQSLYTCDRCNKELNMSMVDRYVVLIKKSPTSTNPRKIKQWDLCKKCYAALYRGIEKGIK